MTEAIANRFQTTLSASVNSSVTTIPLTSVTGAPSGGQWRMLVEDEYMLVVLVVGLNAVVERGIEGSTAASHASGVQATHLLTAGGINQLLDDVPGLVPLTTEVGGVPDLVWDDDNKLVLTEVPR